MREATIAPGWTPRPLRRILPLLLVALALVAGLAARTATAAPASQAERLLAEKWAPIVHLPNVDCEGGRPYEPVDVDILFANPEVALRGPWDRTNLVKVAPVASDLAKGLYDYHLDYPGDALDPGCTYELWQARLDGLAPPTTYARVVTQKGVKDRIALQYWFYYVFNDWNNNHEGDWEMIQINFPAATAQEALTATPTEVGYSQHSSGERARWGDPKLHLVDGTHPEVWPAQGSQANFFESRLYLMRSAAEGVGCDDTRSSDTRVRPRVATVPTGEADYLAEYPWLGFQGRWGEKQLSFFNGPTGPNMKTQWTEPFTWEALYWRDASFTVPDSGPLIGPTATGIFCSTVAAGSELLRIAKASPGATLAMLAAIIFLIVFAFTRTPWHPSDPEDVERTRAWGQILSASWNAYKRSPRVFLGIGLIFLPLGLLITLIQWIAFRVAGFAALVDEAGERNAFVATLALGLGVLISLLGFAVAQAATAWALTRIDAGETVRPGAAYRAILPRLRPLLLSLAVVVVVQLILDLTIVLIPVAIFLLGRWALFAVLAGRDEEGGRGLLRRSATLSHGHWWRVASIGIGVTAVAFLVGPLLGLLALVATSASFNVINIISAVVYVALLPYPAIAMTYLAGDLRARHAAEDARPDPAPATPGDTATA